MRQTARMDQLPTNGYNQRDRIDGVQQSVIAILRRFNRPMSYAEIAMHLFVDRPDISAKWHGKAEKISSVVRHLPVVILGGGLIRLKH